MIDSVYFVNTGEPMVKEIDNDEDLLNVENEARFKDCWVGETIVKFLIDTGASANVLTEVDYQKVLRENQENIIKVTGAAYRRVTGVDARRELTIMGIFKLPVGIRQDQIVLIATFYAVKGASQSLLGYKTSVLLNLVTMSNGEMPEKLIASINVEMEMMGKAPFPCLPIKPLRIRVNKDVRPIRTMHFHVPMGLQEYVRNEIKRLESEGIIEKVEYVDDHWISPVHVVVKESLDKEKKKFRLVVDLRKPNVSIERNPFPTPSIETMLLKIAKAKYFTKLDITGAYHHVPLDQESRKLTGFLTQTGVYQFTRLCFGLKNACEDFQRIMTELFGHIANVQIYMDDLLICEETLEQLEKTTAEVMKVMSTNHLTLNELKCEYNRTELEFLGFTISQQKVSLPETRVEQILRFEKPSTKKLLESFLGMVKYINTFIFNCSKLTATFQPLLKSNQKFVWTEEYDKAFEDLKQATRNAVIKGHYDPLDEFKLFTDASEKAVGAVLVQEDRNTKENRIIGCYSRALTDVESRYSQHDREGLGIVYGIERCENFLIGIKFQLIIDAEAHERLLTAQKKFIPSRMLRRHEAWGLRIAHYDYVVKCVKSADNIADPLTRLISYDSSEIPVNQQVFLEREKLDNIEIAAIHLAYHENWIKLLEKTTREFAEKTSADKELSAVIKCLKEKNKNDKKSWPKELSKYREVREELTEDQGIVIRNSRRVPPESFRSLILKAAHVSHPGQTNMKRIVRGSYWWPEMNKQIVDYCLRCIPCQRNVLVSRPEPLKRRKMPHSPWESVCIDFLQPDAQTHVLVLVDNYSRFLIAKIMRKTDAQTVAITLEEIFQTYGYVNTILSDNGPPFNAEAFEKYLSERQIILDHSTPYQPQENGLAERQMSKLMKAIRCGKMDGESLEKSIANYVQAHNSWPHSMTMIPPSDLFFKRRVRSLMQRFDTYESGWDDDKIVRLDWQKKLKDKKYTDWRRRAKVSKLRAGDFVWCRNLVRENKMQPLYEEAVWEIVEKKGSKLTLQDEDKRTRIRTTSQVKKMHFYKKSEQEESYENDSKFSHDMPTTVTKKTDDDEGVVLEIGDKVLTKKETADIDDVDNEVSTVIKIVSEKEIVVKSNETGIETSVTLQDIYRLYDDKTEQAIEEIQEKSKVMKAKAKEEKRERGPTRKNPPRKCVRPARYKD